MQLVQKPGFDGAYISKSHMDQHLLQGQDLEISQAKDTLRAIEPLARNDDRKTVLQELLRLDAAIFYANKRLKIMATHDSTRFNGAAFRSVRKWVLTKHALKNSIYSCYPM